MNIFIAFIPVVSAGHGITRSMTYIDEFTTEKNCQEAANKIKGNFYEPKCIEVKGFKR